MTKTLISTQPTSSGRASGRRPRTRLMAAQAPSKIANPPATASVLAHHLHPVSVAPTTWNRNTAVRKGIARVSTSREALYWSMKWGMPRRTSHRSICRRRPSFMPCSAKMRTSSRWH